MMRHAKFLMLLIISVNSIALSLANNAAYIGISSQIARKKQLQIVSNNSANTNTPGFEQDRVAFISSDVKQNSRRNNSFVKISNVYRDTEIGSIQQTGNPLDFVIIGKGYFKFATPQGIRYSLNGSIMVNSQRLLVNHADFPLLSAQNDVIQLPEEYRDLYIDNEGLFGNKINPKYIFVRSNYIKNAYNYLMNMQNNYTLICGSDDNNIFYFLNEEENNKLINNKFCKKIFIENKSFYNEKIFSLPTGMYTDKDAINYLLEPL
jgi:flagellar hook-basal body protein